MFSGENALFPDVANIALAKRPQQALTVENLSLLIFLWKLSGLTHRNISQRHKRYIGARVDAIHKIILGNPISCMLTTFWFLDVLASLEETFVIDLMWESFPSDGPPPTSRLLSCYLGAIWVLETEYRVVNPYIYLPTAKYKWGHRGQTWPIWTPFFCLQKVGVNMDSGKDFFPGLHIHLFGRQNWPFLRASSLFRNWGPFSRIEGSSRNSPLYPPAGTSGWLSEYWLRLIKADDENDNFL